MLTSTITIVCAIAALLLVTNANKRVTKLTTIALALASVLYLDPVIGIGPFGHYVFAFVSIIAAVEPSHSLNLKAYHKSFFVITGLVVVLFSLLTALRLPFYIPKLPFGVLYLAFFGYYFANDKRRLKSRLGILIVWAGLALRWVITFI
ncbi:hypothetical protein [Roseivirga pacifica]|uniref:hypothetical protein n=1 Tax=Roseivirga pacifica TaxID=1267423 RepID=UPI003BAB17F8